MYQQTSLLAYFEAKENIGDLIFWVIMGLIFIFFIIAPIVDWIIRNKR